MNFFNMSADPFSLSQALVGRPTYHQLVNRVAGDIVQNIGSKIPGTIGQIAQKVGSLVSQTSQAAPPLRFGPTEQYRTPGGQYHTYTTFAMEKGGVVKKSKLKNRKKK